MPDPTSLADTLRSLTGVEGVKLEPPASPQEIARFETTLPAPLPRDIRAALLVSKGLAIGPLESFSLIDLPGYGMEEMFPHAHAISHDGFGNYWFIDLLPGSRAWSPVWFGNHDPPVIVYQADTIEQFLLDTLAMDEAGADNPVNIVHGEASHRVYRENPGEISRAAGLASADAAIKAFAESLPEGSCIVDLRQAKMGDGINWGRFGPRTPNFRHGTERIWASAPPPKRRSFFERFFGR